MNRPQALLPLLTALALLLALAACSTKKNTASSRRWHAFTARYNTYFNGHQAFLEGEKAKVEGHKDDYTELLPVFLVGVEASRTAGKSNFETAITKCQKAITLHSIKRRPEVSAGKRQSAKMRQYLQRKEYNPFLKNAWLLMGQAQFEKGEFLEAAATFAYIARLYAAEPVVAAEARQWLARCYAQSGWLYDADEALSRVRRDSTNRRTQREMDATMADLLLRQKRYADALPYLTRAARYAGGSLRKARLWFLAGQLNRQLGNDKEAYRALSRCIRQSPPYELAFNARILQTEVAAARPGGDKKMLSRLKRMTRQSKNKDFLDQVYYAMGNIHLARRDTAEAIAAYERGRAKGTRKGVERGVLLLRLGGLYWDRRRFDLAQTCYTEVLSVLDKSREGYEELSRRSRVLDKLVPYTSAVYLQDSLQALSRMDEASRNAAIDRVIEALKRKEEEERRARRDSAAQARAEANGQTGQDNPNQTTTQKQNNRGEQTWYFYNPTAVMQGKETFARQWGKRKNEDNWRRSNRTVLAPEAGEGFDYAADDSLRAAEDSLAQAGEAADSAKTLAPEDDPHQRAYYLKQIPFTPEARQASDEIIMDGLYNAGVIEKDDLEDFPLAASTLERLTDNYPAYKQMPEALYQLFLLYSRWGRTDRAAVVRSRMAASYADNELTRLITDPDYEHNARYGRSIEDSLYAATYQAYRHRDLQTVERNYRRSTDKYPSGLNRPKFIFIHALSRLATAPAADVAKELRDLVSKYPESDVSTLAGMIVKGLESGRKPGTGTFDLSGLWDRRTSAADSTAADAARSRDFSPERVAPYCFVLAYPSDSIDTNKLLYEMAHFNFASFVVTGFDMTVLHEGGLSQFRVSGFSSYDEARAYAQRVFADPQLVPFLRKARALIISKDNLDLLGVSRSFNEYQQYYDKVFAPIKLRPGQPVEEETQRKQRYEDELTPEELRRLNQKQTDDTDNGAADDGGEWY